MRILHLSWEFPPLVYGGIARHVAAVSAAQAAAGHRVTVVTQAHPRAAADEVVGGVRVLRVPHDPPRLAFTPQTVLAWVAGLNSALARRTVQAARDERPDVVHAHDWVVASAAATARDVLDLPLVSTLHATEAGRHQGWINGPASQAIHQVEGWLAGMSDALIVCSTSMAGEVGTLFPAAPAPTVIPNGIDPREWAVARPGSPPGGPPTVVYVGRLEWEKGVFDLLDAVVLLRRRLPDLRVRLVGTGGKEAEVREALRRRRLVRVVDLAGRVPAAVVAGELAAADVAAVPSRYEPFGLTALEAMAVGTPLVVAGTGGLADIADGGRRASVFKPGDVAGLAAAVADVLADPAAARLRADAARASLRTDYDWAVIEGRIARVYRAGVAAAGLRASGASGASAAPLGDPFGPWMSSDPFAEPPGPPLPTGRLLP